MSNTESNQPMQRIWLAALALSAVFAVGAACGVLADRTVLGPPLHRFEFPLGGPLMLRDPFGEVGLNDDQRKKIDAVFERHHTELDAVVRESEPKMRALSEKMDREMQEILTPEQRERLKTARDRIEVVPGPHAPHLMGPGPRGIFVPGPGVSATGSVPWQVPAPPP